MTARTQDDGIAIVGLGALFPGAAACHDFWRNILSGRALIRDVPPTYWLPEDFYDPNPRTPDKVYCKRGAFLDPIEFDPMKYGVPPKLLTSTDTCQLLALLVADQVLHDTLGDRYGAGHGASQGGPHADAAPRDRIGVILGVCSGLELVGEAASRLQRPAFVKVLRERGYPEDEVQAVADAIVSLSPEWNESTFPGLLNNVVTGRIANHFDLGGPNFTTDAACASSFAAVAMAANMLQRGDADCVITGGADTTNDPFTFMCFSKTPALSLSSQCRPFSEAADGTMLGEGIGMMALKRLADAERDGDKIYAVLRACGSSSDGRAKSIYAPRWEGQVRALQRCYAEAGYGPESVELVEAHGTGTAAGDLAEFQALREVFNATGRADRQWCALGSIKSQLGHTKATAGAAGLLKVALALHHKVLPPTLGVDKPAAKLEIEKTPFYLNAEARPWISSGEHPRRAAVSSFGFGGTNFHLALEEYTGKRERARRLRVLPTELVLVADRDRTSVIKAARELDASLVDKPGILAHVARESQQRFRADAGARLAIVAADVEELRARLSQAADAIEKATGPTAAVPPSIFYSEEAPGGGLAFVFPGQGSQYVSMGADVAIAFDAARAVWDEEAATPMGGELPLHDVVFPRPVFSDDERDEASRRLRAIEWAQPAIGATTASLLALLQAVGLKPDAVAGHSFGELSALYAAGSLDRQGFMRVARRRGELMARAAEGGDGSGMSAVTASLEEVERVLAGSNVVVANHNDPRQVVVSGVHSALEDAEKRLAAANLKVQRLGVAAAFHSPIVAPSVEPFARFLGGVAISSPAVPVFANATAAPYPEKVEDIRELLATSIARRVRFVELIDAMYASGVRTFIEVGPGTTLTSMVSRICKDRPHRAIAVDRPARHGVTSLWQTLAQVAVSGRSLDFAPLWQEFDLGADPRLEPKPKMTVKISGTNYGRKYPPEGGAAALPRPNPARMPTQKANGEVMDTKESKSSGAVESGSSAASNGVAQAMPRAPSTRPDEAKLLNGSHPNGSVTRVTAPEAPHEATNGVVVAHEEAMAWPRSDASAWLAAYEAIQCRTAEAHALYQQTMAQCHLAFLHAAEQSALALASVAAGAPVRALSAATSSAPLPALPAPQWSARPARAPAPSARSEASPGGVARQTVDAPPRRPVSAPPAAARPAVSVAAPAVAEAPKPRGPAPAPAAPPVAVPAAKSNGAIALPADGDLQSFLLTIVSEKTGYPKDILNLDQQLEADLGIDSIKRVEILSAFEGHVPDIKDVNLEEVAKLATLRDVLGFMERYADKLGLEKKKI
ncbi:MAG TPA: beta-ketoacyl synthase N-terminal-like domain-containing protein [Polyangiaceae bacterium]|nr:beta-ketoacyl synthase N-terminal-like domain-containing protein [Polyangiaceae bacterium]